MPKFSKSSLNNLKDVSPDLRMLAMLALDYAGKMGKDFSVIEGYRSPERQLELFNSGFSTIKEGKHNLLPSQAIDIIPYHAKEGGLTGNPEQVRKLSVKYNKSYELMNALIHAEFQVIAMCFKLAANELHLKVTWGGDWNNDGSTFDTGFLDYGHFEIGDKNVG